MQPPSPVPVPATKLLPSQDQEEEKKQLNINKGLHHSISTLLRIELTHPLTMVDRITRWPEAFLSVSALHASLKDGNWVDRLLLVMMGLRTTPKEDLEASSAEVFFGALRLCS
ncbi:unnamed protein product [Pleuronectes platessa]|uniref:Uncharacterized protein n=1 Tax=Pleuronectes platessa TaxID=8262 RepID=A0A9N7U275_PLEPL|nr:unnamed protein product [Pleuronectes platessa]